MTRMAGTVCAVMFNVIYTDRQVLIAIHHDILGVLRAILFELPHLESAHKSPPIHSIPSRLIDPLFCRMICALKTV